MIHQLIKHKKTILLTGETGTGKSTWLHRIVNHKGKIIKVNLCEIEENLFNSEMFGHVKGSFTGATQEKNGYVQSAENSILLLDEVGDISLLVQKKLLMFLESKEYYKVGSTQKNLFNGQVLLATNRNLKEMVERGEFRKDLYYRINNYEYKLEPLSENKDIKFIIKKQYAHKLRELSEKRCIREEVITVLANCTWPGNYRQLISSIEYSILNSKDIITVENLPNYLIYDKPLVTGGYYEALESFERKFLKSSLMSYDFKINKTAREVGISKVTLLKKIKQYQLVENDVQSKRPLL